MRLQIEDIGADIVATVKNSAGVAVDLTGAVKKSLIFGKPNGTVGIEKAASFVTTGSDGKIRYKSEAALFDTPGSWTMQTYLIFTDGRELKSDIKNFDVKRNIIVTTTPVSYPQLAVMPICPSNPFLQPDPTAYFLATWNEALGLVGSAGRFSDINGLATWVDDLHLFVRDNAFAARTLHAQISRSNIDTDYNEAELLEKVEVLVRAWGRVDGVGPGILRDLSILNEGNVILTTDPAGKMPTLRRVVSLVHSLDANVRVGAGFQLNQAMIDGNVSTIVSTAADYFDVVSCTYYPTAYGDDYRDVDASVFEPIAAAGKPWKVSELGGTSDGDTFGELAQATLLQRVWDAAVEVGGCDEIDYTYLYDDEDDWLGQGPGMAGMGLRNGPLGTGVSKESRSLWQTLHALHNG